jgi:hypothetical protein
VHDEVSSDRTVSWTVDYYKSIWWVLHLQRCRCPQRGINPFEHTQLPRPIVYYPC